jgi:mono/diheme cytochrome c family protein
MKESSKMSETSADTHTSTDGLGRWLVGGLAGGVVILGLLIAAYAVGYHRGQDHAHSTESKAAPAAPSAVPPTTTAPTPTSTLGPVTATPTLVARGATLYKADGCAACHSLNGSAGVGTSFKGLWGSQVALTDGQNVRADDAYLEQSISNPDAKIVKGYRSGVMSAAVSSRDLASKPNDIRALVAFIKVQK